MGISLKSTEVFFTSMQSDAHAAIHLKGGHVIDPYSQKEGIRDLFIENGRLVENPEEGFFRHAQTVDLDGLIVAPGLTDLQVHLREPGETHKETIQTGSQAAAKGGFTRIVCMPNTRPPCDSPGTLRLIIDAIARDAVIDVLPTGCVTLGSNGEHLAPIGSLKKAGAVALSEGGKCIQNNEIMCRALEYAKMMGMTILDHCQDYSLTRSAVMNEGIWSFKLGLRGWPHEAEDLMVARDAILAEKTGSPIHLQNISSGSAIDIIERMKSRGVPITTEVTPHHFTLTDEVLQGYETCYKMNPPLRSEKDRLRILEALKQGVIDCIACDHAPHSDDDKDVEFDYAPFGVIGLETSLAVTLTQLYHQEGFTLMRILELMASVPDRILGFEKKAILPGNSADLIIFDPNETWVVKKDAFTSKSKNSPWIGSTLKGRCKATLYRGRWVHSEL
jgi:dihydroorotase